GAYERSGFGDEARAWVRPGEAVRARDGHPLDAAAGAAAAGVDLHLRDEGRHAELLGGFEGAGRHLRAEALGGDELLRDALQCRLRPPRGLRALALQDRKSVV